MDALVIKAGVYPWSLAVAGRGRPNQSFPSLRQLTRRSSLAVLSQSSSRSTVQGSGIDQEDALQVFLKERKLGGDFISKVSDALWRRGGMLSDEPENVSRWKEETRFSKSVADEGDGGSLEYTQTKEWNSAEGLAPMYRRLSTQERIFSLERTRKLNLLRYDALKRELLLSTAGIGVACSGYCLFTLSLQAAISYAIGAIFSYLYLQLLCYHSDNLSKKDVPVIFLQKSSRKIGIRSEDLKNLIERTVKGSSIALSSPRLVIPAALYGVWGLSHQLSGNFFDFQIAPAMFGLFAYKAAALFQVYRDNKDLILVLPENDQLPDN